MKVIIQLSVLLLLLLAFGCGQSAGIHLQLGDNNVNQGRYESAIIDYDNALQFDPKNARAFHKRGWAYRNLHQYERAIKDFDEAIRLDPKYARAFNERGYAYFNLKQYDRGIENYDEAIRLHPKLTPAYANRALAFIATGRDAEAAQDIARAVDLGFDRATLENAANEIRQRR